jgi:hypothetical protein
VEGRLTERVEDRHVRSCVWVSQEIIVVMTCVVREEIVSCRRGLGMSSVLERERAEESKGVEGVISNHSHNIFYK